jgi:hypothetical protein
LHFSPQATHVGSPAIRSTLMADRSSEPPFTSLDHLVGVRKQRGRHVEAKRLGGLEVDAEPEPGRLSMMVFAYLPFRQQ